MIACCSPACNGITNSKTTVGKYAGSWHRGFVFINKMRMWSWIQLVSGGGIDIALVAAPWQNLIILSITQIVQLMMMLAMGNHRWNVTKQWILSVYPSMFRFLCLYGLKINLQSQGIISYKQRGGNALFQCFWRCQFNDFGFKEIHKVTVACWGLYLIFVTGTAGFKNFRLVSKKSWLNAKNV